MLSAIGSVAWPAGSTISHPLGRRPCAAKGEPELCLSARFRGRVVRTSNSRLDYVNLSSIKHDDCCPFPSRPIGRAQLRCLSARNSNNSNVGWPAISPPAGTVARAAEEELFVRLSSE